jgi:MFS family permease
LVIYGVFTDSYLWRGLFIVGFLPAILAFAVMRHLEEPKAWRDAIAAGGVKKAGSIPDLFRHPRWRYNVILGMCLAICGVIGRWGIGFFSIDLTQMAFRSTRNAEARKDNGIEKLDFAFIRMLASNPKELLPIADQATKDGKFAPLTPQSFIGKDNDKINDAGVIYRVIVEKRGELEGLNVEGILVALDVDKMDDKGKVVRKAQSPEDKERRRVILAPPVATMEEVIHAPDGDIVKLIIQPVDENVFKQLTTDIAARAKSISGNVFLFAGLASLLFKLGAFVGTWVITLVAERWGRRVAFTVFMSGSFFMTLLVFLKMGTGNLLGSPVAEVFVLQPLLGFCVLSIFGAYTIYFPELFPTRLRSTAVSFCYNIARFAAALGALVQGSLTIWVSTTFPTVDVPMRYAGAIMSVTFIFGIIITWFGPETKGKPLPTE